MHTSERVDRYQHRANVRVDVSILPPFLQILIDALVADLGQQRHVGDTHLLLLEPLLPVGLTRRH